MNNYVECKTQAELEACCNNHDIAIIRNGIFTAWGNSQVTARGNSQVTAWGNSQVTARENSQVTARENSQVTAWGNSQVTARENSQVTARGNSQVTAWGNSQVTALENSQVTARGNSQVNARGNSQVTALDNSQVTARDNSQVTALENSQVTAWDNSQVNAYNYAMIRAYDYSVVKAAGYNAIIRNGDTTEITKNKHCTLIEVPDIVDSLEDYINFYPCKTTETAIYLYKAVKEDLKAFYDGTTQYPNKGKISTDVLSSASSGSCAKGLHFAHFDWATHFGQEKDCKFVVLKARIPKINPQTKRNNIVVSPDCDGKLRCQYAEIVEVITDWQHYKPDY